MLGNTVNVRVENNKTLQLKLTPTWRGKQHFKANFNFIV